MPPNPHQSLQKTQPPGEQYPVLLVRDASPQLTVEPLIDRFDFPFLFKKHWFKLALIPVTCGLLALVFSLFQTPLFRSTATLLVDPNFDRIVQVEGEHDSALDSSIEALKSLEVAVVADSVILRVVDRMNLREEDGFLPESLVDEPELLDSELLLFLKDERFTATLIPETRLIEISVLDPSAERAQRIAKEFSTEFEAFLLEQRNAQLRKTQERLSEQAQKARQAALKSDEMLREFRLKNPGIIVEQDHDLFSQRLTEIGGELNTLKQNRRLYEGKEKALAALDAKESAIDIIEVAGYKDVAHVSELLNALTASKARLDSVAQSYPESHSNYRSANAEVLRNEQQLVHLATDIKSAISSGLQSHREREKLLTAELEEAMSEMGRVKTLSSEFRAIQEQSEKNWSAHQALQQKLTNSEVSEVWTDQIATLVSPPLIPFANETPRPLFSAALGGLVGSILSCGAFLLLMLKGAPVSSRTQLEEQFQMPVLGEFSPEDNFAALSNSSGMTQFLANNFSTVLVTSLDSPESSSSIAQQMAISASKCGRSAIYVKIGDWPSASRIEKIAPNLFELSVAADQVKNVSRFPGDLSRLKLNFDQIFIDADEAKDSQLADFVATQCEHAVIAVQRGTTSKTSVNKRIENLTRFNDKFVSLLLVNSK